MKKEISSKIKNVENIDTKSIFALSSSYVNGYLTLGQMIDVAKKFGLVNKLTADTYASIVRVTDAQLDGQISSKEFKTLYNNLTHDLNDKDKIFLKFSHSVLYSHDRTAIIK